MRGRRDPVMWSRTTVQTLSLSNAQALATTPNSLFGGQTVDAGIDQRLTARRIKLLLMPFSNGVADSDLAAIVGVYMGEVGAPTRAPGMTTATDQQTDWLGLTYVTFTQAAGAVGNAQPQQHNFTSWDIKAMRKLDENQVIAISASLFRLSGAALGADTVGIRVLSSILFSRTRK